EQTLSFQYRLGQLREKQLGDIDGAISAYRTVLEANPEHAESLAAVEALFAARVKQMEIAEILDPLYTNSNEWLKLAGVYEARLANTTGKEERLEQFYSIAGLYEEKLVDYGETLRVYLRALKEAPLDERAGEEAPRLAAGVDAGFETLANSYADILGAHEDVAVQKLIGGRLARTFEEELGDVQRAEETYAYVLGVDPTDSDALVNLDRIHSASENWQELANILEMRVKAPAEAHDLVELYARLGEVYETQLADIPRATLSYRRIFDDLEKTHEGAIAALARIYEAQGAWQELNVVYERELENAPGQSDEADIRAKLAHLAADKLGDGARAVDIWKLVLDLRGEDPEALSALANLYEQQEAWRELVDVLERQCDIASADDDRVNILTRRARVFTEKLGRDDMALDDWQRVLDIDFANLAALRAVAAIRRRQNEPGELTQALHMTVDRASSVL
ncbi:tetratricopeptide repeat protein, partial [bacterium]